MKSTEHGALMLKCPATREAFDSGFRFAPDEFAFVPAGYSMRVRCRSCLKVHAFKLAEAWIAQNNGKGS
jgi:hypothetical protein